MTIEEAVYSFLLADDDVAMLIGNRLYPVIPQDAALPAVAYQRVSGQRTLTHAGPLGLAEARLQFTVVGESYAQAKQVFHALRVALHGRLLNGVIAVISVENEVDGYNIDGFYTIRLDVLVIYQE